MGTPAGNHQSEHQPRITAIDGVWPVGPLGRAIHARGGTPLSVDPSGMGVVLVGDDGPQSVRDRSAETAHPASRLSGVPWQIPVLVTALAIIVIALWPHSDPSASLDASAPAADPEGTSMGANVRRDRAAEQSPPNAAPESRTGVHARQHRKRHEIQRRSTRPRHAARSTGSQQSHAARAPAHNRVSSSSHVAPAAASSGSSQGTGGSSSTPRPHHTPRPASSGSSQGIALVPVH